MKLADFGYFADQNIHPDVVSWLRNQHYRLTTSQEAGQSTEFDDIILRYAYSNGMVVITHDSDFGSLVIRNGQPYVGIIYLRPGHIEPYQTIQSLKQLLEADLEVNAPFIVVVKQTNGQINIRVRQA